MRQAAPSVDIYRNHDERRFSMLGRSALVASHTRCATLGYAAEISASAQESFSLIYMMGDLPAHEHWSDEGHFNVPALAKGSMHIMDLRPSGNARFTSSFDTMNVAIPRAALDTLAANIGVTPPNDLRVPQSWLWRDPVMDGLEASIAHAIAAGPDVDDLVFDHLLLALITHVAISYGEMRAPSPGMRSALGKQQLRKAQDAIVESLENPTGLAEVARMCDLSPSHFSRAFKRATGKTPSAWRLERRIESAQKLLRKDAHSLAEVAQLAGFADQSHFTRSFTRLVGQPPGEWLRLNVQR